MMEYEKFDDISRVFVACLKAYVFGNSKVEVNSERVMNKLLSPKIAVVVFVVGKYSSRAV